MASLELRVASLEEEERVAVGNGEGHRSTPQAEPERNFGISPQKEANGVVSFAIEGGLMSRIVALEAGMSEKHSVGSPAARISEKHSAEISGVAGAVQGVSERLDAVEGQVRHVREMPPAPSASSTSYAGAGQGLTFTLYAVCPRNHLSYPSGIPHSYSAVYP